jgi:hypothetical protein
MLTTEFVNIIEIGRVYIPEEITRIYLVMYKSRLSIGWSWRCESVTGNRDASALPECNVQVLFRRMLTILYNNTRPLLPDQESSTDWFYSL